MLWVYDHDHYKYVYSYTAGIDFRTSEPDVHRRQMLTSKVDPRAVRANLLDVVSDEVSLHSGVIMKGNRFYFPVACSDLHTKHPGE